MGLDSRTNDQCEEHRLCNEVEGRCVSACAPGQAYVAARSENELLRFCGACATPVTQDPIEEFIDRYNDDADRSNRYENGRSSNGGFVPIPDASDEGEDETRAIRASDIVVNKVREDLCETGELVATPLNQRNLGLYCIEDCGDPRDLREEVVDGVYNRPEDPRPRPDPSPNGAPTGN